MTARRLAAIVSCQQRTFNMMEAAMKRTVFVSIGRSDSGSTMSTKSKVSDGFLSAQLRACQVTQ
jgi:hypothetical protein